MTKLTLLGAGAAGQILGGKAGTARAYWELGRLPAAAMMARAKPASPLPLFAQEDVEALAARLADEAAVMEQAGR